MREIGIDLGSSFTTAAAWTEGEVKILENEGNRSIPSMVSFDGQDRLIGAHAAAQLLSNPKNTVFGAKTLLGRKVKPTRPLPFKLSHDKNGLQIKVEYMGKERKFTPVEITAMLISYVTEKAEKELGDKVDRVVIAVPPNFDTPQRQALIRAGEDAGLEVLGLLNEPTAAAISYGFQKKRHSGTIMVISFGGTYLGISVINIQRSRFDVLATIGDTKLRGQDFTDRMVEHFISKYKNDHNDSKANISMEAEESLRNECEEAKKKLSWMAENQKDEPVSIFIENFTREGHLKEKITRNHFEELNNDQFAKLMGKVEDIMKDAKKKKEEIDAVVLVGGSTKMPRIREDLKRLFGDAKINEKVKNEAVAKGAAIYATSLCGSQLREKLVIGEVATNQLCVSKSRPRKDKPEIVTLLYRNERIPAKRYIKVESNGLNVSYGNSDIEIKPDRANFVCEINADGIFGVTPCANRMKSDCLATIDQEEKDRKENTEELNTLAQLVYEVQQLINDHLSKVNSSAAKNRKKKHLKKCSTALNYIREAGNRKKPSGKSKAKKYTEKMKSLRTEYRAAQQNTSSGQSERL